MDSGRSLVLRQDQGRGQGLPGFGKHHPALDGLDDEQLPPELRRPHHPLPGGRDPGLRPCLGGLGRRAGLAREPELRPRALVRHGERTRGLQGEGAAHARRHRLQPGGPRQAPQVQQGHGRRALAGRSAGGAVLGLRELRAQGQRYQRSGGQAPLVLDCGKPREDEALLRGSGQGVLLQEQEDRHVHRRAGHERGRLLHQDHQLPLRVPGRAVEAYPRVGGDKSGPDHEPVQQEVHRRQHVAPHGRRHADPVDLRRRRRQLHAEVGVHEGGLRPESGQRQVHRRRSDAVHLPLHGPEVGADGRRSHDKQALGPLHERGRELLRRRGAAGHLPAGRRGLEPAVGAHGRQPAEARSDRPLRRGAAEEELRAQALDGAGRLR
mmetsp:Transcript_77272/g.202740  ORF Transcript_77272/g.202740 Transcript_77272/m.202740 type:complete len:379 (-) Transcript_77272:1038-2174(-)